ncbi:MAG: MFS transporter [Verrucomicrobiota bacterium]
MRKPATTSRLPLLLGYALGESANSLVTNGLITFALLCYTNALGLSPALAGAALAVSVFLEALTQPLIGHISDHTQSRWGRRYPYIIVGGMLMAVSFYFAWAVPSQFRNQPNMLFGYLIGLHIAVRLSQNMFYIPYLALGYEVTHDDRQRALLQSLRQVFNMAANLAGPALAWTFFFRNQGRESGVSVLENYIRMGGVFTVAMVILILAMVATTWQRGSDEPARAISDERTWRQTFLRDMRAVYLGRDSRQVLIFIFIFTTAMVVMSSLQQYYYEHCLNISGGQKTVAQGSTMVFFAIGAMMSPKLAGKLDKRRALWVGGWVSIACNLLLASLFLTHFVPEGILTTLVSLPITMPLAVFVPLHAGFWLGAGIMLPVVNTMMADVSEIHHLDTGVNRDGGHAAAFNLAMQLAVSAGIAIAGLLVTVVGFKAVTPTQSPETLWRLAAATFLVAPMMIFLSLLTVKDYRVTHEFLAMRRATPQSALAAGVNVKS